VWPRTDGLWQIPAVALAGVRSRRIMAVCFDMLFVAFITAVIWLSLGFLSFGALWLILPPLQPIVGFFYNGLTLSGPRRATIGMGIMDLEARLMNGASVLNAAAHGVLFWFSWIAPVVFLVSLFSTNKRCLHDMLSGIVILRRPLV
jgi:uncharacterized RDD family membrane protein YckC